MTEFVGCTVWRQVFNADLSNPEAHQAKLEWLGNPWTIQHCKGCSCTTNGRLVHSSSDTELLPDAEEVGVEVPAFLDC